LTLVDTNILLDLATDDSDWFDWSLSAIEEAASVGPLYINAIVFGELAARYASVKELNDFVATAGVGFVDLPREAAFLAAKAFARYRELFHRRACAGSGHPDPDARRHPIPNLFSRCAADLAASELRPECAVPTASPSTRR
jgi:predicted nucleic acid-binding protein